MRRAPPPYSGSSSSLSAVVDPALRAVTTLTLQQAVAEALVRNDRILDQADLLAQADLDLRLARNEFRPKIVPNVFGSFGQTDVASQHYHVDVTQRLTTGTELRLGVGTATSQIPDVDGGEDVRFYNADTTLLLTQPLLRGFGPGVARRGLTSAELRRSGVERQHEVVRRQVAIEAATAYYQLVAQHAFVGVAQASVSRGRKLHEAAEAKLAAGLVSQLDVLRARQLRADAENQLADAIAGLDEARDALSLVMGRDPGQPLAVDADIPRVTGRAIDADAAVAIALASRPEMQTLADAVSEANARLAAPQSAAAAGRPQPRDDAPRDRAGLSRELRLQPVSARHVLHHRHAARPDDAEHASSASALIERRSGATGNAITLTAPDHGGSPPRSAPAGSPGARGRRRRRPAST